MDSSAVEAGAGLCLTRLLRTDLLIDCLDPCEKSDGPFRVNTLWVGNQSLNVQGRGRQKMELKLNKRKDMTASEQKTMTQFHSAAFCALSLDLAILGTG